MSSESPVAQGPPKVPVLIFKSRGEGHDPYETQLSDAGYNRLWVPVLTERWILDQLISILREEGAGGRKGVVISSKRGAEGWVRAVEQIASSSPSSSPGSKDPRRSWSEVPLYTVGTSAIDVLDSAQLPDTYRPGKRKRITAKSANTLLPLIGNDENDHSSAGDYLIVRGDKSLDIISDGLRERGHGVEEVLVYTTAPRSDLETAIGKSIAEVRNSGAKSVWVAFFAPSTAGMALPFLRTALPHLGERGPGKEADGVDGKVFAIGETTATYLRNQGINVDAVALEPTPEGMLLALRSSL